MQTRSSSRLTRDQTSNPTSATNTTPKGRNRRSSKQKVENSNLEEHLPPIVTMADNLTMAELLRAPTEGYAEAIVVPLILAEQFELKHSLINMMTTDQFFRLEKDNPHDHIRWGSPPVARKRTPTFYYHAWDRYKDLLRACPHHGFTELHQLDTFYNALNPADQDSLNAAAGGNLLERINQQTSAVITAMTAMLKQFQATPPPPPVKVVEEICVTCGGAHLYYQCLAAGGNTFPEFRDNIQGYVLAAAVNYNQGSGSLLSNTVANPKGELKSITTRSGLVTNGPTVPTPPKSITPEVDEHVEETYTDPDLAEYTIKVPPPPKMLKALLSNKEKLQELAITPLNENCSAVILKKLLEKLGDPGKFLIPCGFSELKCKALADLGASINLMPLSVWKELGLPELIPTRMTLKLANRTICTPAGIARDVFIPVGKFTFPVDFVIVDYESDPRVPLILGRPFLRTARALIDVHEGCNVLSEKLPDLNYTKDLHPPLDDNLLSGSTTYYSNSFLEEVDALPSANNEDKVFNPGIIIQEKPVKIITRVVQDKKLAISNASLVLEDFDPPFYEPLFFKEVPKEKMLLPFSSENEEKVFKPGIHTSEKVHSYFIPKLSYPGYHVFKINQIFKSLMKIFLQCGKNTPILDVPLFHFYPP
nr:reverse transcriptase domain-containing protein [Tanacetum cinerariifolium]